MILLIDCGGVLTNNSGVVTTPGFPGALQANMDCGWRIVVPEDSVIEMSFDYYHFTPLQNEHLDYRDCINYIRIYDAPYPDKQFSRYK